MVVIVCTRLYDIFVSNVMGFKHRNIMTMVTASFCNKENGKNMMKKLTDITLYDFRTTSNLLYTITVTFLITSYISE